MQLQSQVVKVKGIPVEIGGKKYIMPPLSLGSLEQLHEALSSFSTDVQDIKNVKVVVDAAHAALLRNYPDITREEVADGIGLENMEQVLAAVMDVSGMIRKRLEAEAAAGEATPE